MTLRRGALLWAFSWIVADSAAAVTIDFDALAPGTVVTSLGGVGFSSNIVGFDLVVSSGFDTTSPSNYLGVADGGDEVFLGGDEVTLAFPQPVVSLSVAFISVPGISGDIFRIVTPSGTALGNLLPDATLFDGGEVFTIAFASATPFSSAILASDFGVVSYNIDDLVFVFAGPRPVPEPATLPVVAALVALAMRMRPRRRDR